MSIKIYPEESYCVLEFIRLFLNISRIPINVRVSLPSSSVTWLNEKILNVFVAVCTTLYKHCSVSNKYGQKRGCVQKFIRLFLNIVWILIFVRVMRSKNLQQSFSCREWTTYHSVTILNDKTFILSNNKNNRHAKIAYDSSVLEHTVVILRYCVVIKELSLRLITWYDEWISQPSYLVIKVQAQNFDEIAQHSFVPE